jgi:hypothetical protein
MKRFPAGLALALWLACALAGQAQDTMASSPYLPLAEGTAWEYRINENTYTLRVTKHEAVYDPHAKASKMCARVEMLVGGKVVAVEHLRVTSDGIYRYALDGKTHSPPILLLKLPLRRGDEWDVDTTTSAGDKVKGKFTVDLVDIKVGDKSFSGCARVTSKDLEVAGSKVQVTYYFAENFGLIKEEMTLDDQHLLVELEEYKPPKK